jgi:hypothetical protein
VSADVTCQVISSSLLASLQSPWVPAGLPIDNMMIAVANTTSSSSSSCTASQATAHQPEADVSHAAAVSAAAAVIGMASGQHAGSSSSRSDLLVPVPVGCEGEVWVAGPGLAAGYLAANTYEHNQQQQQQQQQQRFLELQLQLEALHNAAGVSTTSTALDTSNSTDAGQQQQQQQLSVAAGAGADLSAASSQQQVWFRTGDLGRMLPDGECTSDCLPTIVVHSCASCTTVIGARVLHISPAISRDISPALLLLLLLLLLLFLNNCTICTGTLQLLGRRDHQVKVTGVRVDLLEVEQVLVKADLAVEVAVNAFPHPAREYDQQLVAYVVPKPSQNHSHIADTAAATVAEPGFIDMEAGGALTAHAAVKLPQQQLGATGALLQQLRAVAVSHLPAAARPAVYVLLPVLPRSSAGKLLRSQLVPPAQLAAVQQHQHHQQQQQQQQQGQDVSLDKEQGQQQQGFIHMQGLRDPATAAARAGNSHSSMPTFSEVDVMRAMISALHGSLAEQQQQRQQQQQADQSNTLTSSLQRTKTSGSNSRLLLPIEPADDFFAAGGDSLAAAAVAGILGIDVRLVYAYPTARSLAAALANSSSSSSAVLNLGQAIRHGYAAARPQKKRLHQQLKDSPAGHLADAVGSSAAAAAAGAAAGLAASTEPAAKRRRSMLLIPEGAVTLSSAAAAAGQQQQGTAATSSSSSSIGELLAAASHAVTVGVASRHHTWGLQNAAAAEPGSKPQMQQQLSDQQQQQQQPLNGLVPQEFQLHWRLPLCRCVDAAPLLLALLAPQQQQQQQQQQQRALGPKTAPQQQLQLLGMYVFACSHDGTIACVHVESGTVCWTVLLPSRADAGMCLSPCARHLAVPCGSTRLYCLAAADGAVQGSINCGGEVRAAPATDPWEWCGCWWVVTHGRELLLLLPGETARIICR